MIYSKKSSRNIRSLCLISSIILISSLQNFGQGISNRALEKMPVDLETDFALSALPPHLRQNATVYLWIPK